VNITLKIHLEPTGALEDGFVWWAESDDLPGFSAAADHLAELVSNAKSAIAELLGADAVIVQQMVFDDDQSERPPVPSAEPFTAPAVQIQQKFDVLQSA
jgi:predicted RNase H-like HicB family nuclease